MDTARTSAPRPRDTSSRHREICTERDVPALHYLLRRQHREDQESLRYPRYRGNLIAEPVPLGVLLAGKVV